MYETLGGIILNINEIKELVSQFDQSTLTEFDLREGQFELYIWFIEFQIRCAFFAHFVS